MRDKNESVNIIIILDGRYATRKCDRLRIRNESSDGTDHEQITSLNQEPLANTNEDYSETTQASSSAGNLLSIDVLYNV